MKKHASASSTANTEKKESIFWFRLALAFFVLLLYGQIISFDFTLDDDSFYVNNELVQKGAGNFVTIFSSTSLGSAGETTVNHPYRPLTMFSFAIDKSLFNATSKGAHIMNLLLYIVLIQVLFSLLRRLFPAAATGFVALITLLFAAHPVHSEVVASIKSRDEILAAMFGFLAWLRILPTTDTKVSQRNIWFAAILLALALLSKESSIAFVALLPLSRWMLFKDTPKMLIRPVLSFISVAALFLIARQVVVGNEKSNAIMQTLDNILFSASNMNEAIGTRFAILYQYLKLLFIPWPLVWDYSFHQIPLSHLSDLYSILGFFSYALLLGFSVYLFRKNPAISFSIFFFFIAIAPVSNLFFINSTSIGERLLFLPSLGFCIGITYFLLSIQHTFLKSTTTKLPRVILAVILVVFSGLTVSATSKWKNNMILFQHGVEVSPNSARTHFNLGTEYWKRAMKGADTRLVAENAQMGIDELNKSIEIYPEQFMAMTNLGCLYDLKGDFDSSRICFEQSLKLHADQPVVLKNLSNIFNKKATQLESGGAKEEAIRYYHQSASFDKQNPAPLNGLGLLYAREKSYDSAFVYLNAALAIDEQDRNTLENIAVISFLAKEYDKAIAYAQKHITLYGNSRQMLGVLSDCYYAKGNYQEVERLRKLLEPSK